MNENSKETQELDPDIDVVIKAYEVVNRHYGGGFSGNCVIAAEVAFEYVLGSGSLANSNRVEIFTVWNAFLFDTFQRPVGHVCLRYFVGEDRNNNEDYIYVDADLKCKEYHEIEAWGHVPMDMATDFLSCTDLEDPLKEHSFGDEEEFGVKVKTFTNLHDFYSSPSYRLFYPET